MDSRSTERHELVLLASTVIGLSRLLDGSLDWLVAGLLAASVVSGTVWFLGAGHVRGIAVASTILPTLAAVACLGVILAEPCLEVAVEKGEPETGVSVPVAELIENAEIVAAVSFAT